MWDIFLDAELFNKWVKIMTIRERIESGKLFTGCCEGLLEDRADCERIIHQLNLTTPEQSLERTQLLNKLFGKETGVELELPFYCCYGYNITIGEGVYINFNCSFLDNGKIIIGEKVLFGPAVTITTIGHPIAADKRKYMYTAPVVIENNCWIGAGVTICPGVTIGENTVIGAGSVVVKDIPSNCVAVGNPCRVVREIDDNDEKYYFNGRIIDAEDLKEEARLHNIE